MLRDDIGVHSATVIASVQKIMDVQPDGNRSQCVRTSNVHDATGGHLLATDDCFGRSNSLVPVFVCPVFHAGEASVETVHEVIGAAHVVMLKIDVIECLTALEEHMRVKFQTGGSPSTRFWRARWPIPT